MPELPEVESIRRGIRPYVQNHQITEVRFNPDKPLRWPFQAEWKHEKIGGSRIHNVTRRGKYLLFALDQGHMILHLGMSGTLRLLEEYQAPGKHDHIDWFLGNGRGDNQGDGVSGQLIMRLTDPRRFGGIIWYADAPEMHPLLRRLGPEPLDTQFTGDDLWRALKKRKSSIKQVLMEGKTIAGIGNIYATESLFFAGIHPAIPAFRLSKNQNIKLLQAIREVLIAAIELGGTSLRDYIQVDGRPGYFKQALKVYGRSSLPCVRCGTLVLTMQLGQRATAFCPVCQPLQA